MSALAWPLSVPVLTDGFVTLRAHHQGDLPAIVDMVTDSETQAWTTVPSQYHREAAEQFLSNVVTPGWDTGHNRIWVIDVNGAFAGQVDLRSTSPVKEIAYATHPEFRRQGITQAAVRLAINYAFTELDTDVIQWRAIVGNIASLRLAYACGFTFHGISPKLLPGDNRGHDAWTGSLSFGEAPYPNSTWAASTIEDSQVRLRPLHVSDWSRWDETLCAPEAQQFLVAVSGPLSTDTAAKRYAHVQWAAARGRACAWAITELGSDDFLGVIVADALDDPYGGSTELEWALHPDARGRGIMSRAVKLVVNHVLSPDGLDQRRLTAYIASSNCPSNAVAQRAGGHLFGTQTASEPLGDGNFDDVNEYEWRR